MPHALLLTICLWLGLSNLAQAVSETSADAPIEIQVQMNGDTLILDTRFQVAASLQEVWTVLTDFEQMHTFMSNLRSSKIVSREGNRFILEQHGSSQRALFLRMNFEALREIQLTPPERIHSRLIRGTMKKFDGETRLQAEGEITHVISHAVSIPNIWIPPLIGRLLIENEIREQLQELRAEILRRKHAHVLPIPAEYSAATPR